MRKRVSAIIFKNNQVLLMHRFKYGEEYYSVPGGGVEDGETLTQALIREIKEEVDLDIKVGRLITSTPSKHYDLPQENYYFLVTEFSGQPALGRGPERDKANHQNRYHPEWLDLKYALKMPNIRPPQAIEVIKSLTD